MHQVYLLPSSPNAVFEPSLLNKTEIYVFFIGYIHQIRNK